MKLLQGDRAPDARWLDALEVQLCADAVCIAASRVSLVSRLSHYVAKLGEQQSLFPSPYITIAGWAEGGVQRMPALQVEEALKEKFRQSRSLDAHSGKSHEGVHRSDFLVRYAAKDMPADQCSTGEQKGLLIAIVLAHALLMQGEKASCPCCCSTKWRRISTTRGGNSCSPALPRLTGRCAADGDGCRRFRFAQGPCAVLRRRGRNGSPPCASWKRSGNDVSRIHGRLGLGFMLARRGGILGRVLPRQPVPAPAGPPAGVLDAGHGRAFHVAHDDAFAAAARAAVLPRRAGDGFRGHFFRHTVVQRGGEIRWRRGQPHQPRRRLGRVPALVHFRPETCFHLCRAPCEHGGGSGGPWRAASTLPCD